MKLLRQVRHFQGLVDAWKYSPDRWTSQQGKIISARLIGRLEGILDILGSSRLPATTVARLERVMEFDSGLDGADLQKAPDPGSEQSVDNLWIQDELPGLWGGNGPLAPDDPSSGLCCDGSQGDCCRCGCHSLTLPGL